MSHQVSLQASLQVAKNILPGIKKGGIRARHSPECRPKMETSHKYHSNINKTAIYHHVSSAIG